MHLHGEVWKCTWQGLSMYSKKILNVHEMIVNVLEGVWQFSYTHNCPFGQR